MAKKRKLPPDPEGMNDDRAEWAASTIRHFQCITGTDYEDALSDLLCDLIHWADRNKCDFDAELIRARAHYDVNRRPKLTPYRRPKLTPLVRGSDGSARPGGAGRGCAAGASAVR